MKLKPDASGVFVVSATPFDDSGALDLDSVESLVNFYLSCGASGLTILGMMGEAPKLSSQEAHQFLKTVLASVAGRVPVVVGVSSAGMRNLAALADESMAAGAAGVMVAPLTTQRTEEQVIGYYKSVCAALGPHTPVVLQDFPLATTVHMSVSTIEAIVEACPTVQMLKHEDWPGLGKISRLRRNETASGKRRVSILVGNGGLHLPQELARGADGAMTGFAYPEMLVQVCRLFAEGSRDSGEDLYDAYLPLLRHEAQPGLGLAIRKEVLRRRGAIRSAHVRTPGPRLDADDLNELDHLIVRLERKIASLTQS